MHLQINKHDTMLTGHLFLPPPNEHTVESLAEVEAKKASPSPISGSKQGRNPVPQKKTSPPKNKGEENNPSIEERYQAHPGIE